LGSAVAVAEASPTKDDAGEEKGSFWKFLRFRKNAKAEEPGEPASEVAESETRETETQATVSASSRTLAKVQARLRTGPVGREPAGRAFLDKIDRNEATSTDLNAFATYLAKRGLTQDALAYEEEALRIDRKNPMLWLNLGTLQRDLGRTSAAASAYRRALTLDPNNALAHYNIGSIHDAAGNYDQAVEEYRIALTLDPGLADPVRNPQIVNNDRLLVVHLLLYQQRAGSLGLPLVQVPAASRGKSE
jgi:tetratricopeptide (TPR) repeat protein